MKCILARYIGTSEATTYGQFTNMYPYHNIIIIIKYFCSVYYVITVVIPVSQLQLARHNVEFCSDENY